MASFYEHLSDSAFRFICSGITTPFNLDTYAFTSISGTLESMHDILIKGRINDAFALLRRYYDSAIINTYCQVYLKDNWLEGGAFLIWRSEIINDERFPCGISIFGSDDATKEWFMLYFDERKISRKYDISFDNNVLTWSRTAPGFSQRYTWTTAEDANTIIGKGELSKDGKTWEKDLEQTFTRTL